MVYEANPAAIIMWFTMVAFTSMSFGNTIDTIRSAMYSCIQGCQS
jgi:hypothetical protein